jgi:WW domain-containing oxidoreductase
MRVTAEQLLNGMDLTNKVIMITGGNSGLGAETARVLSAKGAFIIGLSRTTDTSADLAITCDLTNLQHIRDAIKTIAEQEKRIDVIVCNAGIMALPTLQQVAGYEKQFFVNHMAHFILVTELLPYLNNNGRVVVVASEGYRLARTHGIEWDNLSGECHYKPWRAYGQSKLANILFVKALAQQFNATNHIAIAVHPGAVNTRLSRHMPKWQQRLLKLFAFFIKNVSEGAATQVFAAVHPQASSMNSCYLSNCHSKKIIGTANDLIAAKQLWQVSMEIKEELGFKHGDLL